MTYKYRVDYTSDFKKAYKKIKKQGKNLNKMKTVIEQLLLLIETGSHIDLF